LASVFYRFSALGICRYANCVSLLILQALRKYGDEIKKSLEDLQVDIKQITSSAATEVPEILRNASETSEEVKQITSNLKQFSAVLPYVVRPNWTTVALKVLPSVLSFLHIGKGKKVNNTKGCLACY